MNLQHNLNNLPVISDYDDLVNFNNSLPSSFQPLNIESVSYAKNIIIANGDSIGIDRFLYNYVLSPVKLTGKLFRLKEYDFSKLLLLSHPKEFFESFQAYINNLILLDMFKEEKITLWDFNIHIDKNDLIITKFSNKNAEEIFIPYFITKIGHRAFNGMQNLRKVVIQDGSKLKYIDYEAFAYCRHLKEINLPDSITDIGDSCFREAALESMVFPPKIKGLSNSICKDCKNLTDIVLPKDLTLMANACFMNTPLKSIELPPHVERIYHGTFQNCTSLRRVVLNNELEWIWCETFKNCKSLQEIQFTNSIEVLGANAFECCESLTDIVIPHKAMGIGKETFKNCINLRSVKIEKGVKRIYTEAFYGCKNLKEVQIPDDMEDIGTGAFSHTAIEELTLPKNVKACTEVETLTPITSLKDVKATIAVGCKNLKSVKFV